MLKHLSRGFRPLFRGLKRPVVLLAIAGIAILIGAGWGWWHYVYSSPTRTFERMLGNLLSTTSVSKVQEQQDVTGQSLSQSALVTPAPRHRVEGRNVINQGIATIITENIGTPDTDYIRYASIETSQKNSKGKDFDFSNVVNIWGKSAEGEPPQLYDQNIFGSVPIGNLNATDRKSLLREIREKNIYKIDYANLRRETRGSRPAYVYAVKVDAVPYVEMLKSFARYIGNTRLEQVDPNQYQGSQALEMTFVVDVWSGNLLEVRYGGSERTERYTGYGIFPRIAEPTTTIPLTELQTRLQSLN